MVEPVVSKGTCSEKRTAILLETNLLKAFFQQDARHKKISRMPVRDNDLVYPCEHTMTQHPIDHGTVCTCILMEENCY